MSAVYINTIILVGSEGKYRGKNLGTLNFETNYNRKKDKWVNIWKLVDGPFGLDYGNYFWGTNRNASNHPNHICLDFEGIKTNGVVFNFTKWKLKSPPDIPWFADGDMICGSLWILDNEEDTKISFNASPKK